jgi:hypothetical protein
MLQKFFLGGGSYVGLFICFSTLWGMYLIKKNAKKVKEQRKGGGGAGQEREKQCRYFASN